jgi:hypothetical protein
LRPDLYPAIGARNLHNFGYEGETLVEALDQPWQARKNQGSDHLLV